MPDFCRFEIVGSQQALLIDCQDSRMLSDKLSIDVGNVFLEILIRPGTIFEMQVTIFKGKDGIEMIVSLIEHTVCGIVHTASEVDEDNRSCQQKEKEQAFTRGTNDTVETVFNNHVFTKTIV